MKITYIHQYFTTPDQGGGTRSYEMGRRLVRAGHQVNMITTRREAGFGGWHVRDVAGMTVHELGVPYSNRMSNARRILAFLHFALAASWKAATLKADVIFATSTPLTVAIPGMAASVVRRTPMVFEVRDLWPDVPIALGALKAPWSRWLARRLERLAYARSRHIVALAPGMRDDIVAKGVDPEKVTVIPNGCDAELFQPDAGARQAVLRSLPELGMGPLVVFTGTIGRANGLSYMVDMAAAARSFDPAIRFVVVGDGAERASVEERARQAGLLGTSMFFLGHQPKAEAAKWVVASDMVVCLFTGPRVVWKDAVQNKFFDALAAGKPTASNFEGFQSIVAKKAGIGIILDPASAARGAEQLCAALRDQAWLAQVPTRAQQLASGEFSRDALAARLERVLDATRRRGLARHSCQD
jgi:glycosyltransferase involved in cell wall biosynthesis